MHDEVYSKEFDNPIPKKSEGQRLMEIQRINRAIKQLRKPQHAYGLPINHQYLRGGKK